jgi:hypothetical protein
MSAGPNVIHLHWLYHRGSAGLRGVRLAASMCGVGGLTREEVTSHQDDATCSQCLEAAARDTRTGDQCRKAGENKS